MDMSKTNAKVIGKEEKKDKLENKWKTNRTV